MRRGFPDGARGATGRAPGSCYFFRRFSSAIFWSTYARPIHWAALKFVPPYFSSNSFVGRAVTTSSGQRRSRRVAPSRPPSAIPGPFAKSQETAEIALRVGPAAIDDLVDRLDGVDAIGDDLAAAATVAARMSTRLSGVRHTILDALRRIGPARPWGPPRAALTELEGASDSLQRAVLRANIAAVTFRGGSNLVRTRTREVREGLTALRRTSMGWVFERVSNAVTRFADQQGKAVKLLISGAEVAVDRRE